METGIDSPRDFARSKVQEHVIKTFLLSIGYGIEDYEYSPKEQYYFGDFRLHDLVENLTWNVEAKFGPAWSPNVSIKRRYSETFDGLYLFSRRNRYGLFTPEESWFFSSDYVNPILQQLSPQNTSWNPWVLFPYRNHLKEAIPVCKLKQYANTN